MTNTMKYDKSYDYENILFDKYLLYFQLFYPPYMSTRIKWSVNDEKCVNIIYNKQ